MNNTMTAMHRLEAMIDQWIARPKAVIASAVFVFLAPLLMVFVVLPSLAPYLAAWTPESLNERFAQEAEFYLELQSKPTQLPDEIQARLQARFEQIKASAGVPHANLQFRSGMINAFALTDGTIIMGDFVVRNLGSEDQTIAILAHELGHVHYRHGTQQWFSANTIFYVLLPLLSSDRSSQKVAGQAVQNLLLTSYSRDMEAQADTFAYELLIREKISPMVLGLALTNLQAMSGNVLNSAAFTSTHPHSPARDDAGVRAHHKAVEEGRLPPEKVDRFIRE